MKSFLALSFLSSLYMYFFTVPLMYFLLYPWCIFTVPLMYFLRYPWYILYGAPVFLRYPCWIFYCTPVFLRYPWYIFYMVPLFFYGTPDIFFTVPRIYFLRYPLCIALNSCAMMHVQISHWHFSFSLLHCIQRQKLTLVKLNLSLVLKIL